MGLTLRKKIIIIMSMTFFTLLLVIYSISNYSLKQNFIELEERNMRENVGRIIDLLNKYEKDFKSIYGSLLYMNEKYRLFDDSTSSVFLNRAAIDDYSARLNFIISFFSLDIAVLMDSSNKIVYGVSFDQKKRAARLVPVDFLECISKIPADYFKDETNGVILLNENAISMAILPIRSNRGDIKFKGTLIVGHYLNENDIIDMARMTQMSLKVYSLANPRTRSVIKEVASELTSRGLIAVKYIKPGYISGFTMIPDIFGRPALIFRIDLPQNIYKQGMRGINFAMFSMALSCLALTIITLVFLDKAVISRLLRFGKIIKSIGASNDLSARVACSPRDEFSIFADSFNEMIGTLELSHNKIQESERKFRSLFDNMLDGFSYHKIITDENNKPVDFVYIEVNESFEKMMGIPRSRAIGRKASEIWPDINVSMFDWIDRMGKVAQSGEVAKFENYFKSLDKWFLFSAYSPAPGFFVLVFYDITEQKRYEAAILQSEQKYRELADLLPEIVFELDTEARFTFVNIHAYAVLGYSQEDAFRISDIKSIFSPEEYAKVTENLKRNMNGEALSGIEYNLIKKDGTSLPVIIYSTPIISDGRVKGIRGIAVDITRRKISERELKHRLEWERLIMEISTSFINLSLIEIDIGINEALFKIGEFAGVDRSYIFLMSDDRNYYSNTHEWCASGIASHIRDLQNISVKTTPWWIGKLRRFDNIHITSVDDMPPELYEEKAILQAQAIKSTAVVPMVYGNDLFGFIGFDSVNGKKEWLKEDLNMLRVLGETFVNAICRKKIDTELENARVEAEKAREAADAANHAKDMFLANMSHEIRTPINSILGFSDELSETVLNDEQLELLRCVKTSGSVLLMLINDILDFSKIEAGKLTIENIEVDLVKLINNIVNINKISAMEKGLELSCRIKGNIDFNIMSDSLRLGQILLNLVGNAVKFTEKGKIEIKATVGYETHDSIFILFEVIDEGIGIARDKAEQLFSPFSQADGSTTRKYGGTGLGLAISNQLVKLLGGEKISLESQLGAGSRFYFSIKFKKGSRITEMVAPNASPSEGGQSFRPLKILVAEDNLMNIKLVTRLLCKKGHEVITVENGQMAVETLAREAFDVVLMDVQMPVMDGLTAARKIRSTGNKTLIIAMTAAAMKKDETDCFDAGMDAYISKPVKAAELEKTIRLEVTKRLKAGELTRMEIERPIIAHETKAESAPVADSGRPEDSIDGRIFNFKLFKSNLDDDERIMKEIIKIFFASREEYLGDIKKAITSKNHEMLRHAAHRMKGSALNACATRVANILLEIEKIGADGRVDGTSDLYDQVVREIDFYRAEVDKIKMGAD